MFASPNAVRLLASVMLVWSSLSAFAAEAVKKPTFAWPAPMKFQVEERLNKDGNVWVFKHTFSFTKAKDEYRLAWVDSECLEAKGQKIDTPELKKQLRATELMWLGNPPMRISAAGEFLGCDLTPEVIAKMNDLIDQAVPNRTEESRRKFAEGLATPAGQGIYVGALGQYWLCWVQQWFTAPSISGEKATNQVILPVAKGHTATGITVFQNHGPTISGQKEIVKITAEEMTSGPEYAASLTKSADQIAAQRGGTNDLVVVSAKRQVNYETEIDLSKLRPLSASRKTRVSMEYKGQKPTDGVQEFEYRFFWPDEANVKKSDK